MPYRETSIIENPIIALISSNTSQWNMNSFYSNQAATKILARQLVRLRQQIVNLQGSRAQIRGVATHTQVISLFACNGLVFMLRRMYVKILDI